MASPADDLRSSVAQALPRLRALPEERAAAARQAGKWSCKQILGHLIDSAVNNHQRFVRAQQTDRLVIAGYAQEAWVQLQAYERRPWVHLVTLWEALNLHLAHVIEVTPADRLTTPCVIGESQPATLGWVMSDYVRHLRHHLEQILG